jgi:hypothetical protein
MAWYPRGTLTKMAVPYSLIVRSWKGGEPYWETKWRVDGRQVKRRLGRAWSVRNSGGGWTRRPGRPRDGALDERAAHARSVQAIDHVGEEVAERLWREREAAERPVTVRDLGREWLEWLRDVKRAKPATLRDHQTHLREPGTPYPRGDRVSAGRILAAFGDRPIRDVRTRDVSAFLRALDAEGLTPRNVNKHRQVLGSMFQYACRDDTYELPSNPVTGSDKRREPPPAVE